MTLHPFYKRLWKRSKFHFHTQHDFYVTYIVNCVKNFKLCIIRMNFMWNWRYYSHDMKSDMETSSSSSWQELQNVQKYWIRNIFLAILFGPWKRHKSLFHFSNKIYIAVLK